MKEKIIDYLKLNGIDNKRSLKVVDELIDETKRFGELSLKKMYLVPFSNDIFLRFTDETEEYTYAYSLVFDYNSIDNNKFLTEFIFNGVIPTELLKD